MAKDVGDAIGAAIGHAAREVAQTVSANAHKASKRQPLSGGRGVAAGAGLVALVPLAAKGAGRVVSGLSNGAGPLQRAGEKVGGSVHEAIGKSSGVDGAGKGRRMPIQQAVDVAVPVQIAYNEWTQFEEWPKFMHRLDRVTQEDASHVSFKTKIWGISREFKAEIIEQRPDERIKWRVTEGVSHTGVVTFHELAPRLTRIEVNIDVHPGSLIERLGRGLRHAKRAVRADLHRFKAYVEMEEDASGAWRGEIEDGKVKRQRSSSSRGSRQSASSSSRRSGSSNGSSASKRSSSSRSGSSRASSSNGSASSRKKAASSS